ncbi:MAG TPA: sensor histidine kinase [Patescibacteria group bacterium]|nr:sensor histidine kinase [Patescibacteria group bacterium]
MRLRDFIGGNRALIIAEWERFAALQTPAAEGMTVFALKDHIGEILDDILADMDRAQSPTEQEAKSKGQAIQAPLDSAAETHAAGRAESGFTIKQLTAEFRALRASIIRLWTQDRDTADKSDLNDLTRFNETIDQALTESLVRYSADIQEARDMFLGILGHDLRSPLQAVMGAAEIIASGMMPERSPLMATTIMSSARRMKHMITDLVELTRVRLGNGIILHPAPANLRSFCAGVIREMQAIHPARSFALGGVESAEAAIDSARFSQVMSNLLGNAVQHGDADKPITVTINQTPAQTTVAVHNEGRPIPPETLPHIFEAFVQGRAQRGGKGQASLGLGLYIASQIVKAHGGTITVASTAETGTTFTVILPPAS